MTDDWHPQPAAMPHTSIHRHDGVFEICHSDRPIATLGLALLALDDPRIDQILRDHRASFCNVDGDQIWPPSSDVPQQYAIVVDPDNQPAWAGLPRPGDTLRGGTRRATVGGVRYKDSAQFFPTKAVVLLEDGIDAALLEKDLQTPGHRPAAYLSARNSGTVTPVAPAIAPATADGGYVTRVGQITKVLPEIHSVEVILYQPQQPAVL